MTNYCRGKMIFVIIYSVLLGFMLTIAPGFIFCILLTALLLLLTLKNTDEQDKIYISLIFFLAITLRLIALYVVQNYCLFKGITDIIGDALDNINRGFMISDFLRGEADNLPISLSFKQYNAHILTIFNGIFFALFGKDVFSLKYINILCIALSGWMIYDLGKKIFNSMVGKIAMTIFLFFPTLLLWSITDLKESHFIFAIVAMLWSLDMAIKKNKSIGIRVVFFCLFIFSAIYTLLIRASFMMPFIASYLGILLICLLLNSVSSVNYIRKAVSSITIIILVLILIIARTNILQLMKSFYEQMISANYGFLTTGGWNYNIIGDINQNHYTFQFFFTYIIKALFHLLFEPFPWHIFSAKILAYYPTVIIWYLILFFSFLGLIKAFRLGKIKEIFPMLLFLFLYITLIGMIIPNIGTVVRMRDAILPILSILASLCISNFTCNYNDKK